MNKFSGTGKVIHAGNMSYPFALGLMKTIVNIKQKKTWPEILLLLEHPPTITLGKRATAKDILVTDRVLGSYGIGVHKVERGGFATYHGPGQLVGYILMDLKRNHMSPEQLVDRIETAIIHALSKYCINAGRYRGHRGVWVETKKIASIGIAVQGGITFHGFALNCNPTLSHFDFINPCGLKPGTMTSITELSGVSISPDDIKQSLANHLKDHIGIDFSINSLNQLLEKVHDEQKRRGRIRGTPSRSPASPQIGELLPQ